MKMKSKVLLSVNLAFCLLSSTAMALEDQDSSGTLPSKSTTAQSVPQIGADVPTACSGLSQKTKQVSEALESTEVVVRNYDKGDQKGPDSIAQASSSARALSLDSTPTASQQRVTMRSLSEPLMRTILLCLTPRESCGIARVFSTINTIVANDEFFWGQIYHRSYPHHLFNAMEPKEKETAITLFKRYSTHLSYPIDLGTGRGFRKAFQTYSKSPDKLEEDLSFFSSVVGFPTVILLNNSPMALKALHDNEREEQYWRREVALKEQSRARWGSYHAGGGIPSRALWEANQVSLWSFEVRKAEAILETLGFTNEVYEKAIYAFAAARPSDGRDYYRVFDKYVVRAIPNARYYRARALTSDWWGWNGTSNIEFARGEMTALCDLNHFKALKYRLSGLGHGGLLFSQHPPIAAQEYERCRILFHQDPKKLLQLAEVYTEKRRPIRNRAEYILQKFNVLVAEE